MGGRLDLAQPTINALYNTRQAQESFLRWADNTASYYDFIRATHNGGYTPAMMKSDSTWNMAVHNGTFSASLPMAIPVAPEAAPRMADGEKPMAIKTVVAETPQTEKALEAPVVVAAPTVNVSAAIAAVTAMKVGQWELALYQKVTMGTGNQANNPYLQETPDPITKVTWDNYVTMSPADAKEAGFTTLLGQDSAASVVKVVVNGKEKVLPVFPAPGQKRGTIGIALGYGRGEGNEPIGNAACQHKHRR